MLTHVFPSFPRRVRPILLVGLLSGLFSSGGCKELTGSPGLPAGTPDPTSYNNATGAVGMRNAAVWYLEFAVPQYIADAGLLTDELEDPGTGAGAGLSLQISSVSDPLDERFLPEGQATVTSYANLQTVRTYTLQALGALAAYDTATVDIAAAKVARGELYAFLGYDEILLADLFCSGVPLSTIDFNKSFTYAPSSTWRQVYLDAIAKFDTALTLTNKTSDSVVNLTLVLRGRAELALGNYAVAADDVKAVPNGFLYQISLGWTIDPGGGTGVGAGAFSFNDVATVADREGKNGLDYQSSGDPRTASVGVSVSPVTGDSVFFPAKYSAALSAAGYAPFTIASGIEARLIQAEAQLQPATAPSGPWLATLNALRENVSNIQTVTNKTYTADSVLHDLTDPGLAPGENTAAAATARIKLLFRERAFWLFLDGHRQGDLRRLIREYGGVQRIGAGAFQTSAQVYPTGAYLAPGLGTYGSDVTAPPDNETPNPFYHGCLDRNP